MTIQLTLDKTAIAHILEVAGDELLIKLKQNIVDQVVRSKIKSILDTSGKQVFNAAIKEEIGEFDYWTNTLVRLSPNFVNKVKTQIATMVNAIVDQTIAEVAAAECSRMEKKYQYALDEHCKKMIAQIPKKMEAEINLMQAIRAYKENQE